MGQAIENISNKKRVGWIDIGKGISMLLIIMYHVETRYDCVTSEWLQFCQPFRVFFFFFLSGYLYSSSTNVDVQRKLGQLARGVIMPYIIFCTIIYIPKAMNMGREDISFQSFFTEIFFGQASWFVMALTVGQLIMLLITKLGNWLLILLVSFFVYALAEIIDPYIEFQPWYFINGMRCVPYLALGYLFRRNVEKFNFMHNAYTFLVGITLYSILYFIDLNSLGMSILSTKVILSIAGIFMMIPFTIIVEKHCAARVQLILKYVGRNSLVFYFINGSVISMFVILAHKLGYPSSDLYIRTICLGGMAILVMFAITKFINAYIPFITGNKDAFKKVINSFKAK